ncbi:hypothetical protein BDQ94DRAFT_149813 [Aspergillus welwitschiae]|uniref:Uncharacterized protein n=1 Tax=Aspergillus welwitschiae TaxID=1341132 RepID=A0A3F3PTX4_9EURO|nr:hypothetical protein BDQ94DRAFT_149813 [Aspergillus welwitschiae]RDH29746.1 hypothetical protein BDQ94DRAFT_149813 [Aspergillus welwitschiae]
MFPSGDLHLSLDRLIGDTTWPDSMHPKINHTWTLVRQHVMSAAAIIRMTRIFPLMTCIWGSQLRGTSSREGFSSPCLCVIGTCWAIPKIV